MEGIIGGIVPNPDESRVEQDARTWHWPSHFRDGLSSALAIQEELGIDILGQEGEFLRVVAPAGWEEETISESEFRFYDGVGHLRVTTYEPTHGDSYMAIQE